MSTITVTDANGVCKVIDMKPVEEFVGFITGRKSDMPRELKLLKSLSKDQLQYVVIELMFELRQERNHARFLYTKAGREHIAEVEKLKELAAEAGFDLWPDWGD